ncbi:MAG: hypothetical protein ACP5L0_03375 [Caldisphaera sp.]|jgi:serine/threonine protein phosphatase PrpC|uniref:hypothetical protein n=1 Tax=Caldisphaera sp. TaxID=2060322 RepID=UPI000CC35793|nr:MAG: hypothetical protein C0201_04745 [Caldisphaera sp.]
MAKSEIAKLAETIAWFEDSLKKLNEESKELSSDLVQLADSLGREIRQTSKFLSDESVKKLEEAYKESVKKLEEAYKEKEKEELENSEKMGKENYDKAVKEVFDQIKKIVSG